MDIGLDAFDENFQTIFHNWKENDPKTCNQNRSFDPCRVCQELEKKGKIVKPSDGATYFYQNDPKNQYLDND